MGEGTLLCKPTSNSEFVWLRRVDGSVSFDRDWNNYVAGFGNPRGNYWLGLETLHVITTLETFRLVVELESWAGQLGSATYTHFSVADQSAGYRLSVNGFMQQGIIMYDAMYFSNGQEFSTIDRDRDGREGSCVKEYGGGGWWYDNCADARPTGTYGMEGDEYAPFMFWYNAFGEGDKALKAMTMKLIPV